MSFVGGDRSRDCADHLCAIGPAHRLRHPALWRAPGPVLVPDPNRQVQGTREADPGQIRNKQPSGQVPKPKKQSHRCQDGEPQQQDLHHRYSNSMAAKEDEAPAKVQGQLHPEQQQRPAPQLRIRAFPDHPRGDGHQRIEDRPDRPKNRVGRIEAGLRQPRIPACNRRRGQHCGRRCNRIGR
jgi:hypothetical protein